MPRQAPRAARRLEHDRGDDVAAQQPPQEPANGWVQAVAVAPVREVQREAAPAATAAASPHPSRSSKELEEDP
eukprot:8264905-Lingulodinium_polyedra.AAC.2